MKNRIPYILFLFSTIFSYGQVTLAVSEVKDQKVNQPFNLTVLLEIAGENMQQETPLRMPDTSKFDIIGTASEQNTIVLDAKKGNVLNQMVYQMVLSPKRAGKVTFGSVLVTVNGKIYKTEPFEINVRENDRKSSVATTSQSEDVYLNMEVKDKEVYKNEPTVAVLRAYSRDFNNFRKVGNIQYPRDRNIRIKPVSFAKSEIESHSDIASQVIAVFMIFPSETGTVEVPPVSASISGSSREEKISSNKVRLNVKKLPSGMPVHFKNAVGNFAVSVANNSTVEVAEIDKPVNISVQISGSGNFGTLHLPKIVNSTDYVFFEPKISVKTSAKENRLSGILNADYVVIPKRSGPISISFENFSYFDPETKKYIDGMINSLNPLHLMVKNRSQYRTQDSRLTEIGSIYHLNAYYYVLIGKDLNSALKNINIALWYDPENKQYLVLKSMILLGLGDKVQSNSAWNEAISDIHISKKNQFTAVMFVNRCCFLNEFLYSCRKKSK